MINNGWEILFHTVFNDQFEELVSDVDKLKTKNPTEYKKHPKAQLLARVYYSITRDVPLNPFHPKFQQGKTLGKNLTHWKRVKKGLPKRHRLFFQAKIEPIKRVIFAWLNIESCLRKAGDKKDVYVVFKHIVKSGRIPNDFASLHGQSMPPNSL